MQDFKTFFSDLIDNFSVIPGSKWEDFSSKLTCFIELTESAVEMVVKELEKIGGDVFEFNGMYGSVAGSRLVLSDRVDVGFSGDFQELTKTAKKEIEVTLEKIKEARPISFPLSCCIDNEIENVRADDVASELMKNIQVWFRDHYILHCKHAAVDEIKIDICDDMFSKCFGSSSYHTFGSFDDLDRFTELLNFDTLINYFLVKNDIDKLNESALLKHGNKIMDGFCQKKDFKAFSKFNFNWVYESYSFSEAKFDRWKAPLYFKSLAFILKWQGHDSAAHFFEYDVIQKIDSGFHYGYLLNSTDLGISVKAMKECAQVKLPKMMVRAIAIYLNKYCLDDLNKTVDRIQQRLA